MHNWKFFKAGRIPQVKIECGADIENLKELDRKLWTVLSCPMKGLRFDKRTLEFLDSDHDGHVRAPEVIAAVDWLKGKGVDLDSLFKKDEADAKALEDVTAQQAALDKAPPSEEDLAAMKAWEEAPSKDAAILPFGDKTASANDALAAVEPVIDEFFAVPADMPLVTEEADKVLPLKKNLNPKWAAAVGAFAAVAIDPGTESLSRADWAAAKAKLAPYRAWLASKPVMAADAKAKLEEQEKLLRLKLNFVEFLRNFVNQGGLYDYGSLAIYQTGTLYIDAREMPLTFHVDDAGAHSALAGRSECYLLYVKLTRDGGATSRTVCAAVTAGFAGSLWPGKNGVFIDRDGLDWDATVTSVVEKQISLREAFWAPWKKICTTVAEQAKKFLGAKQDAAVSNVTAKATAAPAAPADKGANGAAIASSIAAIGIGAHRARRRTSALEGRARAPVRAPHRLAAERDPHVLQAPQARHRRDPQRVRLGCQPSALLLHEAREALHPRGEDPGVCEPGARPVRGRPSRAQHDHRDPPAARSRRRRVVVLLPVPPRQVRRRAGACRRNGARAACREFLREPRDGVRQV